MSQCCDTHTSAPSSTRRCHEGTGGGNTKTSKGCALNLKLATRRCVVQQCGSGGLSVRSSRLRHGFTSASLTSLYAMDKESLGKALQDCLSALGTGQGAHVIQGTQTKESPGDQSPSIPSTKDTKNTDTYRVWMGVNVVPTCHPSQARGLILQ